MSIIRPGEEWTGNLSGMNTVFLAGPSKSPRTNFVSYRKTLVELASKEIPNLVIFYPEFDLENDSLGNTNNFSPTLQDWEQKSMGNSKVIVIGFDTDANNLGLTTRTEFGFLSVTRKNLIVYVPKTSYKMDYQIRLAMNHGICICETLKEVIEALKKMINDKPVVKRECYSDTYIFSNRCDPIVLRDTLAEEEKGEGNIWCAIPTDDYRNYRLFVEHLCPRYRFHHGNDKMVVFCNMNYPHGPADVPSDLIPLIDRDEKETQ